jgi:hypothetical protein
MATTQVRPSRDIQFDSTMAYRVNVLNDARALKESPLRGVVRKNLVI